MPKIFISATTHDLAEARLVAKRGLETLSLRNIATAHGCSKGMVEHYYDKQRA